MISATPSPFARMNRIALHEKGIDFDLQNEIPWHGTTVTPQYNPLEKLPILIFPDSEKQEPIYDSAFIQDFIVQKYADKAPKLLTDNLDLNLKARQILTLSEGVLDAFVLVFFESRRPEDKQSKEWTARQNRKLDGGMRAFSELVKARKPEGSKWLIGDTYTIADIAVACAVAQIDFGQLRPDWKEQYPELSAWWQEIESREFFQKTTPKMFDLTESVV